MAAPVVLVVSPDRDTLTVFGAALRHAGFEVRELDDPDRVLGAALAERPSLVITNFPTPAAKLTVTELLRGEARTAAVPILNVTSHVFPAELRRAESAGVTASLPMPVPLAALVAAARRLVEEPAGESSHDSRPSDADIA
ncbi:MAG TPA: hypothetical protein VFZ11_07730 [Gemmatimonadaceae bacterium]